MTMRFAMVVLLLGALLAGCNGGCSCQRAEPPEPETSPRGHPADTSGLEVIRPDTADVMRPQERPSPRPAPERTAEPETSLPPAEPRVERRGRTPLFDIRREFVNAPIPMPKREGEPEEKAEPPQAPVVELMEGPFGVLFARIAAGSYLIGSDEGEPGRDLDEGPRKAIMVPEFWLSQTEVTLRQWQAVMGELPFRWRSVNAPPQWTLDEPVQYVSWDDVQKFLAVLSEKSGHPYRLPTESEWEYACRGGTETMFWPGDAEAELRAADRIGPYGVLREVKSTEQSNPFGLYDMLGNVSEWVEDDYVDSYAGLPQDGRAYTHTPRLAMKLARGGNFLSSPGSSRSASREPLEPGTRFSTVGFRIATDRMTEIAWRK